ncbi:MAG: hypothetical protein HC814_05170, partial [Rhodobacteraceae bacterium]|nr:hypothetical protein [Paracoccaceae bacterium]
MKISTTLIILAVIALVGVIAWRWLGTVIQPKVEQRLAQIGLTDNEKAANGPLPGDVSLYQKELECCQGLSTPGYFSSLNGAENADSERSSFFPCATFTGSFDGPNKVYAWRSEDGYEGCSYINNRRPGELYILGGDFPPLDGVIPSGPYLAKADATTGRQIWRTYLDNGNASGHWIANANLNILPDGNIPVAWGNQIVLIDGDNGRILKHNFLPTGECPKEDANFKHMTIAPDGTLIMKDQTRPTGSKLQGTMAIIKGIQDGLAQSNSVLLAVHPTTLEVIDELQLPEPCSSPHVVTMFEGRIAIYIGMNQSARRYFWDPATKKLSADKSWEIYPMAKGQTTATAPTPIGEWIAFQLNGAGSKEAASSIVVAKQNDPKQMKVVFPFGELKKGEMSFAPPKCGADIENFMIYSADMGVGKVAGIKLDPATGELETRFILDNMSTTFQPVYGPKDKRVLVLTNMKKNVAHEPTMLMLMTANYKEQVTWHDALTG